MKLFKLAIAAVFALTATSVYAFHSGGVAECGGCHSMHSPAAPNANGGFLLIGVDRSSTCLNSSCHGATGQSSYHVFTPDADAPLGVPPVNQTPGGDFQWLKKKYTWVVRGNTNTDHGGGHAVNAAAVLLNSAPSATENTVAPGGTYPTADLNCNSCHDPHGKYRRNSGSDAVATTGQAIYASGSYNGAGNEPNGTNAVGAYRLLAGAAYAPVGLTAAPFPGVPAAKVKSGYNTSESATTTRVAYGVVSAAGNTTWAQWCGTCHPNMHSGNGNYVHPTDQALGSAIAANYNQYVMSGNMTGNAGNSFSSLAPFATNSGATYAILATTSTQSAGPSQADQVTCISCHRAHASGFSEALRFTPEAEFMIYNGLYPGTDNGVPAQFARGRTSTETQRSYYDRPVTAFANYQRIYCNKCHAKD